ncbi:response regulator [Muricauda oceani]|uniref:Response regulator n=1 Tax=Flagellimonas oceani TaxID=2698672 RepID=A0A6G7J437_9FLAO|nr:response regulator [Allomuricauda oceani]MBW8242717.1 response regulator [Allomuricauda oceani]QII45546.1 response regulator [Allomuricauda oceani]
MDGLRIFLVDDDKEDQEFFRDALSEINEAVLLSIFNSGDELLRALRQKDSKPDMIYLDLHMPILDGEECLDILRKNTDLKSVPIVIYSTELDMDRIAQLFFKGANRYIRKPDSFDSLVASIKATINSLKRNSLGGNAIINIVV